MYNLITSVILLIPAGNVDGRETYHLIINDKVIEYAYKEEIQNFYKTGVFQYDENLTTKTK
jgi:hypothetical protein